MLQRDTSDEIQSPRRQRMHLPPRVHEARAHERAAPVLLSAPNILSRFLVAPGPVLRRTSRRTMNPRKRPQCTP